MSNMKIMVKSINYWFYDCYYKIDFIKEVDEAYKKNSIDGYARDGKNKTFNENESGNAIFVKLIFTVRKN